MTADVFWGTEAIDSYFIGTSHAEAPVHLENIP